FLDVISVLTQVLSALCAAHEKNIIHRDIKPENVFLTERVGCAPVAKILDFGISKSNSEAGDLSLTRTGMVMGTPYYMAPEQVRGDRIDHRVDIYACGVILYEALTGRRPFLAANYNALAVLVLSTHARDPREIRPAIPTGFVPIIYQALAKRCDDRFRDARAFIEALTELRDELARGPGPAEIAQLARQARGSARPPPKLPSAPPPFPNQHPPVSEESIEIPVVFSDTGTDARAQCVLDSSEVPVHLDTGSRSSYDIAHEIGDASDFRDVLPGGSCASGRVVGPRSDDDVHDTIVDPTGAMRVDLWAQLPGRAPPPGALLRAHKKSSSSILRSVSEPQVDTDPTVRTVGLDAEGAGAVLQELDEVARATFDMDDHLPTRPTGLRSLVSERPAQAEDVPAERVAPVGPPPQHAAAVRKDPPGRSSSERPSVRSEQADPEGDSFMGSPGLRSLDEPPPARVLPRVPRPGVSPRSSPPSAEGAVDAEEPDDDSVTTRFVSTRNGPCRAGTQAPEQPQQPSADRPEKARHGTGPPGAPGV
ncbi:MAG: protein kinase, partial [Polyangiaceae bacterium]|nr:protein kinase [Polyangiaceae bacterium]